VDVKTGKIVKVFKNGFSTILIFGIFALLVSFLFLTIRQQFSNEEYDTMSGRHDLREGDGFWKKNELTFFIKDKEGILTPTKKLAIENAIFSKRREGEGFLGWNSALSELNNLFPDNDVPDTLTQVEDENSADIIITVYSEKEFCCSFGGEPVTGVERSLVDSDFVKHKSDVSVYNILDIDIGFLEDMTRHEIGHTLGIFKHTERENDLMSLESPSNYIKRPNLQDLYEKYKNLVPVDVEAQRELERSRNK